MRVSKGGLEASIQMLDFENLTIFRPGLLFNGRKPTVQARK
jgi:hypothetical protein